MIAIGTEACERYFATHAGNRGIRRPDRNTMYGSLSRVARNAQFRGIEGLPPEKPAGSWVLAELGHSRFEAGHSELCSSIANCRMRALTWSHLICPYIF